jgi:hypothetical protein
MPNEKMDWAFCILKDDDGYYLYYVKPYARFGRKVYRMRSSDGITGWKDSPDDKAVLKGESGTRYEMGVTCPTVWKEGDLYHMIFSGLDKDNKWRAFYAKSKDGASDWSVQNNDRPIIDTGGLCRWDHNSAEPTGVIKVGNRYYCWYNNIDCNGAKSRQMGLATTSNLQVEWEKDTKNPIFKDGRFCPSPIKYGGKYYLFVCHFDGSTRKSEIELYSCDNPMFHPDDPTRTPPRVIKRRDERSSWEANVLDPVYVLTDNINRDTLLASDGQLWMYYGANTDYPSVQESKERGIGLCIAHMQERALQVKTR